MSVGPDIFIGVDGGGSRTRVRVVDSHGHVIGQAEGGAANVYLKPDAALATLDEALAQALETASIGDDKRARTSLAMGLAGVSSEAIGATVRAHFAPRFGRVIVRNDAVIACLGAHGGRDGGLVIAGTGSAAVLRRGEQDTNIGGRGFLLGDDGSGAVMGRQAWRRALRAHDGLETYTPFLRDLMADFDGDPVAVIAWGRGASSGQFGAYAPRIVAAAQAGDPVAREIVGEAGHAVTELAQALWRLGAPRVSLVGGLAEPLRPYLGDATRARLEPPLRDALDGALFLAGASYDG